VKKLKDIAKALWFWYVVRAWWSWFPPKPQDPRSAVKHPGQTLDDE
jgi:hypothetical protein